MKAFIIYFLCAAITIVSMVGCNDFSGWLKQDKKIDTDSTLLSPIKTEQDKITYDKIKRFYQEHFSDTILNGGFLVAKNGKIIFETYNGTIHPGKNDSINMQTSLHIASTSKTFTAMAILKLAEQKKLNIKDSVHRYLPKFPYKGITIKTLLNHRSGLPNYMNVMNPKDWKNKKVSNQDVLDFFITHKPAMQGRPDGQFTYCNTNYVLLALIIEQITQMKYADFLKATFFDPLGMQSTFVGNSVYQKTKAPTYRSDNKEEAITWLDDTYGDKNIFSTPRDLLKWDQALYDTTLFSNETLDAAFTPYSFEKPGNQNYGLGWRMYVLPNNKKLVYHNGWWHGSNTCFYRVISDSITIICIGNKMNNNIYRVKPLIEEISSVRFSEKEEEE